MGNQQSDNQIGNNDNQIDSMNNQPSDQTDNISNQENDKCNRIQESRTPKNTREISKTRSSSPVNDDNLFDRRRVMNPHSRKISTRKLRTRSSSPVKMDNPYARGRSRLGNTKKKVTKRNIKQDYSNTFLKTVDEMLKDKSHEGEINSYVDRIRQSGGLLAKHKFSMRDNDLVMFMAQVCANDPCITEVDIIRDQRFTYLKNSFVQNFATSIRFNLHLTNLTMIGIGLDNEFLSALSLSLESNFMLEFVCLTDNEFTNEGLVDFCHAMGESKTLQSADLRRQRSPVWSISEDAVLESLAKNVYLEEFHIDFKSPSCGKRVEEIIERNHKAKKPELDYDKLLLQNLKKEAEVAEAASEQRRIDGTVQQLTAEDWEYIYKLSEVAQKYSLTAGSEEEGNVTQPNLNVVSSDLSDVTFNFTNDGAFLTNEFIDTYLQEGKEEGTLTFAFHNQNKMSKRFPVGNSCRKFIFEKLGNVLLDHPRAKEITHINMANSSCGDEWSVQIASRCLKNPKLLPKLSFLNLETNYITGTGVAALCRCVADRKTWEYLQVFLLDNQRFPMSSKAELELVKALHDNWSVIRFSLRVRNMWERQKINKFISRNLDYRRQARVKNAITAGVQVERHRNEIEQYFDKIAANDPSITEVVVVGNKVFVSLPKDEKVKAAKAFGENNKIKNVKMTMCKLDDHFAHFLATSLEKNCTIEILSLDNNIISGKGIKDIVQSLAKKSTVVEFRARNQGKSMATSEEEELINLIGDNDTLCRLSLDLRSQRAQNEIQRRMKQNNDKRRAKQFAAKKDHKTKKRNVIQQIFDKIEINDPEVISLELTGDMVFLSMRKKDVLETASSFANNTHLKTVKMNRLNLDDAYAKALAASIKSSSIEKLDLNSNNIGSDGIIAIISSLVDNKHLVEIQIRHQTKHMAFTDEEELINLLSDNETISKVGIDMRSQTARAKLYTLLQNNRDKQRKARVAAKKKAKEAEKK